MDKIENKTYLIAAAALVIIVLAIYFLFIFKGRVKEGRLNEEPGEIKSITEIVITKRPYITLTPTTDGAEIIMAIENMGEFERLEYELTYLADNPQIAGEKIQRGSTGTDINPKDEKYKKSILLGTASRGVRSPDKGITDGKLILHLYKDGVEYQSETPWTLIQAGSKAATIEDSTKNLSLTLPKLDGDHWIILADTVGLPVENRQVDAKNVILPVWGAFSVADKFASSAKVSIKSEKGLSSASLYSFAAQNSQWVKLDSEYDNQSKTITFVVDSFATFVVVLENRK